MSILRDVIRTALAARDAQKMPPNSNDTFGGLWAGQHRASPDRRAWRTEKRRVGFRQARIAQKAERRAIRVAAGLEEPRNG